MNKKTAAGEATVFKKTIKFLYNAELLKRVKLNNSILSISHKYD